MHSILSTSLHNLQSGIRWVVYNIIEDVMLDLLRKGVIWEMIDAHIIVFNTDGDAEGLSKRLLVPNLFMTPVATFWHEKYIAISEKKDNPAFACE